MILNKKRLLIFFLTYCLIISVQAQNAFIKDSLDTFITREMARWKIPGLAIAVVKDGKVVASKGYGVRELGKPEKVDENTLFQIASNTKAFTGTSLALLEHQKRLSLDDKVIKWMPDFKLFNKFTTKEVTVRDLLCHRIGLQTFQGDFLNWDSNLTRKEIIDKISSNTPKYLFRSNYGYCNSAFVTAGEIVPLVTDTTWNDYIKYHFFQPLNMTRTVSSYADFMKDANRCSPHSVFEDRSILLPRAVNTDNLGPAASISSSVKDLSNWLLMQLDSGRLNNKTIIPYAALSKTRSSQMVAGDVNSKMFPGRHFNNYGLGWFLSDYYGRKMIDHTGGANGFVTTTCFLPEERLGIAILTNSDANELYYGLLYQIIDTYLNLPYRNYSKQLYEFSQEYTKGDQQKIADLKLKIIKKPTLKSEEYMGKYKNEVYGEIEIKEDKGLKIYFSHHPFLTGSLQPLQGGSFLCTYSDPTYGIHETKVTEENGKIKSITVKVNDFIDYLPYEFKKIN